MSTYSVATNVTSPTMSGTTTQTFTWVPVKVGNVMVLAVGWLASTSNITSVTATNGTVATIQAKVSGSVGSNTWAFQFFIITASSTSSGTVSIVFNVAPTSIQVDYMEFTADWVGNNPANWLFKVVAPAFKASSTTITWNALTGFSFDEFYVGYGFMGGGAFSGTNGTPAGFTYNPGAGNGNPFCWNLAYGVGPSTPSGTQAAAGTYMVFAAVLQLYPSLIPATIDAGST